MKTYNLYADVKYSIWNREKYSIEADSEKEALNLIRSRNAIPIDIYSMFDTEEYLSPDDNGGCSTMEIYNDKGEILYVNSENI